MLVAEIVLVSGFFIPFAISAVMLTLSGFLLKNQPGLLVQLVVFAGLGAVLIPVARKGIVSLRKPGDRDINQY